MGKCYLKCNLRMRIQRVERRGGETGVMQTSGASSSCLVEEHQDGRFLPDRRSFVQKKKPSYPSVLPCSCSTWRVKSSNCSWMTEFPTDRVAAQRITAETRHARARTIAMTKTMGTTVPASPS